MWRTIQVFYYKEAKNALMADGIRPVIEQLGRQGAWDRCWLESHWKHGPHIRLHIESSEERFHQQVLPAIQAEVGRYLQKHPSRLKLNPAELEALHRELGDREYEEGPYLPFMPDNSIQTTAYTLRPRFWGGEGTAALAQQFFHETNGLLLELAHEVRDDYRRRLSWAMALMLATAGATGDLKGKFLCFRSHSQGFLGGEDPDGQIRTAMNEWYLQSENEIARSLQKWADMVSGRRRPDIRIARYMEIIRDFQGRLSTALEAGQARAFGMADFRQVEEEREPGSTEHWPTVLSQYHDFMLRIPSIKAFSDSHRFEAFRYVINFTYSLLTTLGLSALERYFLCYGITRFMEQRYYRQRWWEIVLEDEEAPPGYNLAELVDGY